jgi:hypothetical protein
VESTVNVIYLDITQAAYLALWSSEFSRLERVGCSLVLLSVVEVMEVLVDVLFSVNGLFLLCRDPVFPLTVSVDSTTISSKGSPNAAVKTRQIRKYMHV